MYTATVKNVSGGKEGASTPKPQMPTEAYLDELFEQCALEGEALEQQYDAEAEVEGAVEDALIAAGHINLESSQEVA